ncbi:MAG: hypothetical protein Q4C47_07895 [Planctomycetia bacterium]|nr:hypothetical protein [Planctomycetia bacterium]
MRVVRSDVESSGGIAPGSAGGAIGDHSHQGPRIGRGLSGGTGRTTGCDDRGVIGANGETWTKTRKTSWSVERIRAMTGRYPRV